MPEPVQQQPLRCRFAMTAADAKSSHEFCVFEFPGCEGCLQAIHLIKTVGSSEDPMKSVALSRWIAGASVPKSSFAHNQGDYANGRVHSPTEPGPVQEAPR